MQFKIAALCFLLISFSCIGQEVKSMKMDEQKNKINLGLNQPAKDFMKDFDATTDLLIVKIENQYYAISPTELAPLIVDVSLMSRIPPWNAQLSYYRNGRTIYTNARYVLAIDTKNIDPKIFKKIKHDERKQEQNSEHR